MADKEHLLYNEPGMGADGKAALLEAVKDGKGFIAFHCGSDTFHSPTTTRSNDLPLRRSRLPRGPATLDPYIADARRRVHHPRRAAEIDAHCVDPQVPRRQGPRTLEPAGRVVLAEELRARPARDPRPGHAGDEGPHVRAAARPTPKPGPACTARGASSSRRWATARTSGPTPTSRP